MTTSIMTNAGAIVETRHVNESRAQATIYRKPDHPAASAVASKGDRSSAGAPQQAPDGNLTEATWVTLGSSDAKSDDLGVMLRRLAQISKTASSSASSQEASASSTSGVEPAPINPDANQQTQQGQTPLAIPSENLASAKGTFIDTDLGSAMAQFSRYSALSQIAKSMVTQANQQTQQIAQLAR